MSLLLLYGLESLLNLDNNRVQKYFGKVLKDLIAYDKKLCLVQVF